MGNTLSNTKSNAFFLSDTDIEHDIWKLSYELFAEEALLSNKKLLVTYYGFNKVALGPFTILKYEFKELDFISEVQEKYVLAHEFGHWIFHIKKSNNTLSILNLKNNLSDLMEEIKAMLSEIYNQYGKIFQDKDYLKVISEQNNIVENNDDIIEECFADAVAYAFVFSYISSEYNHIKWLKIVVGILSIGIGALFGFVLFISLIFTNFGESKIIQTVNSPDGTYVAISISHDDGALGGDTCVRVINNKQKAALLIGSITHREQQLWIGEWSEEPTLKWEDNDTILINDVSYDVE